MKVRVGMKRDWNSTTLLPVTSAQLYLLSGNHLSAKRDSRQATTSCIDNTINISGGSSFPKILKKFQIYSQQVLHSFSSLFLSLFTLSLGLQHRLLSCPRPSYFAQIFAKKNKKSAHILLRPKGRKICSSAANRKPLKDSVLLQKQQRCHAIGFTADQWEGSIRGECCEKGKWGCMCEGEKKGDGSLAAGPDVSTLCVGARMDKWQNMSVREWACVKDVFAPTFSSAAQGGYSHCLEVFSCVPLGPTRRLVTHLKVSFSVVQHHLKN